MPLRQGPRPEPGYDPAAHFKSNKGNIGTRLLLPDADCEVKKPSWSGTETVFRPYPSVSYSDPQQFEPYRKDPGGRNYFGHWIRRYDCAWGVGTPATTFLLNDPSSGDRTYDPWTTPLGVLYRAIENACKKGQGKPEWYPLREGGAGRGKALRAPAEVYLMQGAILKINSKPCFGSGRVPLGWGPNPPIILMLSSGIGKKLVDLLNMENEGYRGDPGDFEAKYVYGDPVAPDLGRFFHFFQKGFDPRSRYAANPSSRGSSAFDTNYNTQKAGGKDDDELGGFDMFIADRLEPEGLSAKFDTPEKTDMIRNKWRFWEDILFFPTPTEQAHILAQIFPASAIIYAFEGVNSDWIPEEIHKKSKNTVSANVGGDVPSSSNSSNDVWAGYANPTAQPKQEKAKPVTKVEESSVKQEAYHQDSAVPDGSIDDDNEEDDPDLVKTPGEKESFAFDTPPAAKVEKTDVRTAESVAKLMAARAKASKK